MARKEKIFHYIYKTTNLLNGKYYFGMHSTDNLNDNYFGSGKRLKYSVNKYGIENHKVEILEFVLDRKSLAKREKEIINLNEIAKEECMNLMVGGSGGFISVEQQRNRAICAGKAFAKKLKENPEFREAHRKLVSGNMKKNHELGKIKHDTFTDKKHTDKTKKLISISNTNHGLGSDNSQYGTCWIRKNNINKKIKLSEIDNYIQDGWIKGRKFLLPV